MIKYKFTIKFITTDLFLLPDWTRNDYICMVVHRTYFFNSIRNAIMWLKKFSIRT